MGAIINPEEFGGRVLSWFDLHGRKSLPWQKPRTPYRVWVSEIMLQQTRVTTVIPYFERFMIRFPDIGALADADPDAVLHLWSGLGYYARARNLPRAAVVVRDRYAGELPLEVETLRKLPGIGRSTAGAILALATGQRHAILDGNVKRILARFRAVQGWPGQARIESGLWELAARYTPTERVADYTQAMMDLGAMVCTLRRPRCDVCPLADGCMARQRGQQGAYPTPRPRKTLPVRTTRMLILQTPEGRVLLEKRPPGGIWGGLWSFPECAMEEQVEGWCRQRLGARVVAMRPRAVIRHTFSHFHLDIAPLLVSVIHAGGSVMEAERLIWYDLQENQECGLAAPVQRLLKILANERSPARSFASAGKTL